MPYRLFLAFILWCWWSTPILALTVEELDPARGRWVKDIVISGNEAFSEGEILATLRTKERPWYFPWKERPVFDPVTFTTDLERLQRFYEARGYYQSRVTYDHPFQRDCIRTLR
jgi:outer membrane protein assembly factor BamA